MECIIESGQPIPAHGNERLIKTEMAAKILAAVDALDIGENLFWPDPTTSAWNNVKVHASRRAKATGKCFTVRLMSDGVRCWRVD